MSSSSTRQLVQRNELVDWQVAPAEYEIANYDEPKFRYRKLVEDYIHPLSKKSLKKKSFITIVTNVLCADTATSRDTVDPIDRDIYLPLEICLTKWSVSDAKLDMPDRQLKSQVWLINPGPPTRGCNHYASEHKKFHKIDVTQATSSDNILSEDLDQVVKEINTFLLPERIVFSMGLKYCRQDLGALKWLNKATGYKTRPIKVFSLEDLYVVLLRHMNQDNSGTICQGFARHRMETATNPYDENIQCIYHQNQFKRDPEMACCYCAKALAESRSHVLLDDIFIHTDLAGDLAPEAQTSSQDSHASLGG